MKLFINFQSNQLKQLSLCKYMIKWGSNQIGANGAKYLSKMNLPNLKQLYLCTDFNLCN